MRYRAPTFPQTSKTEYSRACATGRKQRYPKFPRKWSFDRAREFNLRYEKRTYLSREVRQDWPVWISARVDEVVQSKNDLRRIMVHVQPIGGNKSQFCKNNAKGHSYSWRDSTMLCVMDCFYPVDDAHTQAQAEAWQNGNDSGIGNDGVFSDEDRRVFWGSYGGFDLRAHHKFYYDNEDVYVKLLSVKKFYDPRNVFTPNTFGLRSE